MRLQIYAPVPQSITGEVDDLPEISSFSPNMNSWLESSRRLKASIQEVRKLALQLDQEARMKVYDTEAQVKYLRQIQDSSLNYWTTLGVVLYGLYIFTAVRGSLLLWRCLIGHKAAEDEAHEQMGQRLHVRHWKMSR